MPTFHQTGFIEATVGEIQYHRFDFSVEDHDFVMIFSAVEISDVEYLQMRSEEVGFSIPERCYDVSLTVWRILTVVISTHHRHQMLFSVSLGIRA
ncbi:hypothetical protein [Photorhabdus sp. RM71S]|uniref:hypothetical protein n=1 Tax=Photorhabdus sp. RM71S TaxID=3342824 RepID=UPI0036DB8247